MKDRLPGAVSIRLCKKKVVSLSQVGGVRILDLRAVGGTFKCLAEARNLYILHAASAAPKKDTQNTTTFLFSNIFKTLT